MRRVSFALAAVLCAAPSLFAQSEKAAAPAATLPAGWEARFDRENADPSKASFAIMGNGLHVTSGPAAIYWRTADNMKGDFRISATFTQTRAPAHPEAYGIFVGGRNLGTDTQEYGYLIIRGDGKYMIKHRMGSELHTVAEWTDLAALNKADENGKATNTVAFDVAGGAVRALVNGVEVKRWEKGDWSAEGIAGLRVNHQLDVHIADFAVTPAK